MATPEDIEQVRKNTDEPTQDTFADEYVGGQVDALGVSGASASLWRQKAATYAKLVNTTEGGASRSLSDLSKNALAMAKAYDGTEAAVDADVAHPVSRRIVR